MNTTALLTIVINIMFGMYMVFDTNEAIDGTLKICIGVAGIIGPIVDYVCPWSIPYFEKRLISRDDAATTTC